MEKKGGREVGESKDKLEPLTMSRTDEDGLKSTLVSAKIQIK